MFSLLFYHILVIAVMYRPMSVFVQERQWKQTFAFTCVIRVYSVLICYVCTKLHVILNKYIYLQQTIYQISNLHGSELSRLVGGHKQYLIATTALCGCSCHCMPGLRHTLLLIHDLWFLFLTFLVLLYQPTLSVSSIVIPQSHANPPTPLPKRNLSLHNLPSAFLFFFILHLRLSGQWLQQGDSRPRHTPRVLLVLTAELKAKIITYTK